MGNMKKLGKQIFILINNLIQSPQGNENLEISSSGTQMRIKEEVSRKKVKRIKKELHKLI